MPNLPATPVYSDVSLAFNIAPGMDGMYWGIMVSTMLFGITISQAWNYANHNRDSWGLRGFVALLVMMDFAITCLGWQALRFYLLINFGNPLALLAMTTPWTTSVVLIEVVATVTEWFFASRIYLLNKKALWAPILACLLATGGFVCVTMTIHNNIVEPSIGRLASKYNKVLVGTGLGFTLCTVLLITAVLVTRLNSAYTNVKSTRSTIQKLLLFFATRGLLVTLNQLAFLIVYEATPVTAMHWIPFLLLDPKLHVITMMAMLNSRQSLSSAPKSVHIDTIKFNTFAKKTGTSDSDSTALPLPKDIPDRVGGYSNNELGTREV